MIARADWVKLNRDEAALLFGFAYGAEQEYSQGLAELISRYRLQGIVLTCGAEGAAAMTAADSRVYTVQPDSAAVSLTDTVGAGDAFASVVILGILRAWSLETTLTRAQAFASAVVGQRGATVTDRSFYNNFTGQWQAGIEPIETTETE